MILRCIWVAFSFYLSIEGFALFLDQYTIEEAANMGFTIEILLPFYRIRDFIELWPLMIGVGMLLFSPIGNVQKTAQKILHLGILLSVIIYPLLEYPANLIFFAIAIAIAIAIALALELGLITVISCFNRKEITCK